MTGVYWTPQNIPSAVVLTLGNKVVLHCIFMPPPPPQPHTPHPFFILYFTLCRNNIFDKKKLDDPSQLILTFEVTDLVGIVSLLYGMLLHSGAPSRGDGAPPELSAQTLAIAISGLRMLNHMAVLDLSMLQVRAWEVMLWVVVAVVVVVVKRLEGP